MKSYGQDIADLKKLADKFEKDLASLGVDVDDLKKGLAGLDKRVTALEKRKLPIEHITGEVTTVSLNGYSTSGSYGVDEAGRPTGFGRGSSVGHPSGADQDFTFLHEVAVGFKTTNDTGAKGEASIIIGNMNDTPGGGAGAFSQVSQRAGTGYLEGPESVYLQKAFVSYDLAGCQHRAAVARLDAFRLSESASTSSSDPTTPLTSAISAGMTGTTTSTVLMSAPSSAVLVVHVFAARVGVSVDTAGQHGSRRWSPAAAHATTGGNLSGRQQRRPPLMVVNQLLGAHLWVPIGKTGDVDRSATCSLDSNTFATDASFTGGANRIVRTTAETPSFKFGMIKAWGGYSRSDIYQELAHLAHQEYPAHATGYAGYEAVTSGACRPAIKLHRAALRSTRLLGSHR